MQKSTPIFLLLETYLDFFFYGPDANSCPSPLKAAVGKSGASSAFPSSPIYRSLAWMDLDYQAMEQAWGYACQKSPWVEPILRSRYTPPYASFVTLAAEWGVTVRTVAYWHQKGGLAFLEVYGQLTHTRQTFAETPSLEMDSYLGAFDHY